MKKYILRTVLFLSILIVCDQLYGLMCRQLKEKSAKASNEKVLSSELARADVDMVVLGSSRALNHYDPRILEDSLNLTVRNCGLSGMGIICNYALFRLLAEQHDTQLVVYDINPPYDLLVSDNHAYLGLLREFYGHPVVDSIFESVDKNEKWKMLSQCYIWNPTNVRKLISNYFKEPKVEAEDLKGFYPEKGYKKKNHLTTADKPAHFAFDSLKISYLERMADDCKARNIHLVFAVSPLFANTTEPELAPLREICERKNVPLLNYYTNSALNSEPSVYLNSKHLNESGAEIYSKRFAGDLRRVLKK